MDDFVALLLDLKAGGTKIVDDSSDGRLGPVGLEEVREHVNLEAEGQRRGDYTANSIASVEYSRETRDSNRNPQFFETNCRRAANLMKPLSVTRTFPYFSLKTNTFPPTTPFPRSTMEPA